MQKHSAVISKLQKTAKENQGVVQNEEKCQDSRCLGEVFFSHTLGTTLG